MTKFLDPDGLKSRGIEHFDGWAATFGEVVESMEISPDGASLRPRSRFAKFVNLPELQQMWRSFADVQTADMLNLPRPRLQGGKPIVIACPMSEEQAALQQELVERYERLRSAKIDPRVDNALAITTDGRKLALDARMLSEKAEDYPDSKINALVDNVHAIWQRTEATRGTQMIFADLGVHPTKWGFSVYDEIIGKLVARGIPRSQIAAIGDADSDAKKRVLFDKVRSGQVRVLLGSTQKMGAGTNVQKRLVALHHLDAPWKPAEVEQREGRILRQGNDNEEVAIYRYVTEKSFDSYIWQALETKAKFIGQLMTGRSGVRRAEDIGGQELSYAEVKAIASGNPAVLTLAEADAELQRLNVLKKNHADEQYLARRSLKTLPDTIARYRDLLAAIKTDRDTVAAHRGDPLILGGKPITREYALIELSDRLDTLPVHVSQTRSFPMGQYRGLRFGVTMHPLGSAEVYLKGAATRDALLSREHHGPRAVLNAMERMTNSYDSECERVGKDLGVTESQQRDYQARLGAPFAHEDYLARLTSLRDHLKAALSGAAEEQDGKTPALELAERIKALRGVHTVEAAPERTIQRRDAGEEPVTARILRRVENKAVVNGEDGQAPQREGKWQRRVAAEAQDRSEQGREPG